MLFCKGHWGLRKDNFVPFLHCPFETAPLTDLEPGFPSKIEAVATATRAPSMHVSSCAVLRCQSRLNLVVLIRAALLLTSILCASCGLPAQDGSTSLQGIIEDVIGARIAGAAITVSDSSRGLQLRTVTDAEGTFDFGMLPPGRYDVTASAPGMTTRPAAGSNYWSAECRWCNCDWRRRLLRKP